ncbi:MAG TPA: outer-membrane lipoprotein carrier protein LolA [Spirochaetales bacterium]|nr:outer-membrane lipoprotein carrier protein LolA [Spirochaetales bacterium]
MHRKNNRFIFIGWILFLLSTSLGGQEILTAEIFFDRISNTYGEVKDYIAQVTITVEKDVMEGTLYYKTPNLLRIDFSVPAEQVLVTDGKKLTIYIPQYRVVMAQTLKRRSAAAIASMASRQGLILLKRNYSIAYLNSPNPVPLDDKSKEMVTKLRLSWKSSDEGFRELVLSVNADGIIRRIEGVTVGYQKIVFDFKNIRINENIPEGRFRYDPPASANVVENFLFDPES